MADKTFGFKVNEDVYERAKGLIEASGLTSKEWFENVLATYEVKVLQQISPEYARDLTELELHTTRIYDLVVNMVQQSIYFKDHAVKEVSVHLDKKEQLVAELHEKLQTTKQALQALQLEKDELNVLQLEQSKQLEEGRTAIENSQLLIAEYKEKNDSLTGLVAKYQGYAAENEQLKTSFAEEKAQILAAAQAEKLSLEKALSNTTAEVHTHKNTIATLEKTVSEEQVAAAQATQIAQERHEVALERALVRAEREYQEKLQAQLDTYNTRISELQAENDRIRQSYEERLQAQLDTYNTRISDLQAENDRIRQSYE